MKNNLIKKSLLSALCIALVATSIGCGSTVASTQVDEQKASSSIANDTEIANETSSVEEVTTTDETVATDEAVSVAPEVEVSFEAGIIPDTAVELTSNMKLGWNLGNTLDAEGGHGLDSETSWGQPKATQELIQYVRECGFTTIRIPVSWHNHITDGVIDPAWMDRVQEVVDWSLDAGLYVILNSHHDNNMYYPSEENYESAREYLVTEWIQIAERFRDYDEHLIFESMNEPRLAGTDIEWWFADSDVEGNKCIKVVNQLNQAFVDTIRNNDSYNQTRFLMVPCAIAAPQNALNQNFEMPTDTIENHLILSVHAYTPYDFTMNDNGYSKWGSDKTSEFNFMGILKSRFVNNGYGVVIGEFGATNKDNINDRCAWAKDYCGRASTLGIPCVLWDNGGTAVGNENFGMINRRNLSLYYPELLDAMLEQYK